MNFELKGRTVVLGTGSEFRGDDSAGLKVVERTSKQVSSSRVLFIKAGPVPESFTSRVKDFAPNSVLFIDSVNLGEDPGTISQIDPANIIEDSVSTHRLPLTKLINYLRAETGADIVFLGIQPARTELGSGVSNEVEKAIGELVNILTEKLE